MTTYTSQPDETSGIDTRILFDAATTNYATDAIVAIGQADPTNVQRTLIKFDLSSIPSTAVISSAILSLWTQEDFSNNARDIKVYRILRNWVEAQATWDIYSTGNNWGTAGCGNTTTDYDGANVWATTNVGAAVANNTEIQWTFSATGITELTKLINGTNTNYGWLMKADTESNDIYAYHSSSGATSGYRPKLVIEYSTNQTVIGGII